MTATLALNATITFTGNLLTDIAVAHAAGYTAVELAGRKADQALAAGISHGTLKDALADLQVCNVAAVLDLERRGADRAAFRAEVEHMSALAASFQAPQIQLCTGPVDRSVAAAHRAGTLAADDSRYRGDVGATRGEAVAHTAESIADAARIAADYGLSVAVECLAWTPVSRLADARRAVEMSGADNASLCIDFWHCWAAGDRPEDLAVLPAELIGGVQVADGLAFDRERELPDQQRDRDVLVGGGVVPLQEWADAAAATGYAGWYSAEMFSTRAKQLDPVRLAGAMRSLLEILTA